MLEDKDNLLQVLKWHDSRKEFEKIFYSMIGIFDQKLNLGTQDCLILDFVSSFDSISKDAEYYTINMINSLNSISKLIPDQIVGTFNKRLIKFICLLSGLGFVDFTVNTEDKLAKLCNINSKISVFSSAQKNAVENEFKGNEELQEKYRLVALVGRGSHSFSRVKERMQVLSEIMSE